MPDDGKIIMCQIREKIEKFFIYFLRNRSRVENKKKDGEKYLHKICFKFYQILTYFIFLTFNNFFNTQ